MTNSFFAHQLAIYASYHRDPRNRITHVIGIPAIVFSILVPLALARVDSLGVSWAVIVAALALIGWITLDAVVGLAMAIMLLPMLLIAEWIARTTSVSTVWIVFAIFFVGGWVFQLVGHVWEGRRPALVDNIFQAFIGPMFIMAEVLVMCGVRTELKAAIEQSTQHAR